MASNVPLIQLSDNNLYSSGYLFLFPDTDEVQLYRDKLDIQPVEGDDWHIVLEGQTLSWIAWSKYTKVALDASKLWWIIADANNIYNPFDIDEWRGKALLIPDYYRVRLLINNLING